MRSYYYKEFYPKEIIEIIQLNIFMFQQKINLKYFSSRNKSVIKIKLYINNSRTCNVVMS